MLEGVEQCSDLSEKFVVTSQQLKEELQEAGGIDQILIPQKNQRFAKSLTKTGNKQKHLNTNTHVICININKLMFPVLEITYNMSSNI